MYKTSSCKSGHILSLFFTPRKKCNTTFLLTPPSQTTHVPTTSNAQGFLSATFSNIPLALNQLINTIQSSNRGNTRTGYCRSISVHPIPADTCAVCHTPSYHQHFTCNNKGLPVSYTPTKCGTGITAGHLDSVEWNGGLERWNGTVDWNGGMEWWNEVS